MSDQIIVRTTEWRSETEHDVRFYQIDAKTRNDLVSYLEGSPLERVSAGLSDILRSIEARQRAALPNAPERSLREICVVEWIRRQGKLIEPIEEFSCARF